MQAEHEALTSEVEERIWNTIEDGESETVNVIEKIRLNAINSRYVGTVNLESGEYWFVADSTDWNGSEITYFSQFKPDEEEPAQTVYRFYPKRDDVVQFRSVYTKLRKEGWLQEKERRMNYDYLFEPTNKTREHYRTWADSKGLQIICVERDTEEDPDSDKFKWPKAS